MAALCVLTIERNYRIPDGIILAYPAINCSKRKFSPSMLLALDDEILPMSFLKLCLNSYYGNPCSDDFRFSMNYSDPTTNPTINPTTLTTPR